jgi:hypothetical protein
MCRWWGDQAVGVPCLESAVSEGITGFFVLFARSQPLGLCLLCNLSMSAAKFRYSPRGL